MKQIQFIFFLSTLFLISCQNNAKQTDNSKKFPIVLDTVGIGEFLNSRGEEDPSLLAVANYKVYFIGKIKDSVYLSSCIFCPPPPPPLRPLTDKTYISEQESPFDKYYIGRHKKTTYKNRLEGKIDIQFDTAVKISSLFPVMVTNRETDTIFIGYGSHVPLIMEAMDSLGTWQPIQENFKYICGHGLGLIILPPNESVLTLAPTFKGNYKKKLRLTLGENHSKPFIGFIDYRL
jgi:hypothetical protein